MIKDNIATYVTTLGGLFLIGMGLLGLWFPGLLGMRLGLVVNLAHLGSGAAALYWGLNSRSLASLRVFCLGLGVLYGVAGLVGLGLGGPGNIFTVLSGNPVMPSINHLFHLILGAIFVWAGMVQPMAAITPRTH